MIGDRDGREDEPAGPPVPGPAASARGVGRAHLALQQPRQHQHALGARDETLGPDSLEHVFEVPHVGGHHVQQRVGLARHRAGIDHLGVPRHRGRDQGRRRLALAVELDVRLRRPAEGGGVDNGGEAGDDAGRAQLVDPPLHRRRAQTDHSADVGEARPRVVAQRGHDALVDVVERHRYIRRLSRNAMRGP